MTKIKLCGLSSVSDIEAANAIKPEYIGFVFAEKSKRYVSKAQAAVLKSKLDADIKAVGVFLDNDIDTVASMIELGIIDIVEHQHDVSDILLFFRCEVIEIKAETHHHILCLVIPDLFALGRCLIFHGSPHVIHEEKNIII